MENINRLNHDKFGNSHKSISKYHQPFVRSPIQKIIANQSIQSDSQDRYCQNHGNKKANFSTQAQNQYLYFCQKCAITLASQGHNITKMNQTNIIQQSRKQYRQHSIKDANLQQNQIEDKRKHQIENLLTTLTNISETINLASNQIHQKLIQSQEFYGQQIQQINDYFNLVIKSLQLQKNKCYNHILVERKKSQQHIRTMQSSLLNLKEEVSKIKLDIQENLETVYSIEEGMYKLVINQYESQKTDFQRIIDRLIVQPVQMTKIEFQGVPENIHNLSDIVIQNSLRRPANSYKLIDSLNGEDFNNIRAVSPHKSQEEYLNNYMQMSNNQNLKFSFEAANLKNNKYVCALSNSFEEQ